MIPAVVLLVLAVLVTRGVERLMPESLPGLLGIALVAGGVLWGLSAGLFALLYGLEAPGAARFFGTEGGLRHFLALGGRAALIWAPMMLLVVITAPRRWKTATW